MIITRTYHVGTFGLIHASTDLINFVAKSIPDTALLSLNDVETDPNDGDKVFVVGESDSQLSVYGIYVSEDGGNTWTIPGGNYADYPNDWNEITVVDSDTILVCGKGSAVCRSLDGGSTFNYLPQIQILPDHLGNITHQECFSIHFISKDIGVVGLANNTVKTINGGVTWIPCYSGTGLLGNVIGTAGNNNIKGIHISQNSQIVIAVAPYCIMRSTNGGASYIKVHDFNGREHGIHLTWEDDLRLWATASRGLERVRSINGGINWNTISYDAQSDLGHLAAHFYYGENGFYSQQDLKIGQEGIAYLEKTIDGGVSPSQQVDSVTGTIQQVINAVWTNYRNISCYRVTDCENFINSHITTTDLSAYVGQYIQLTSEVPPIPIPIFPPVTAEDLEGYEEDNYYILTNCCQGYPSLIIAYLGIIFEDYDQVISFTAQDEITGLCYTVSQHQGPITPEEVSFILINSETLPIKEWGIDCAPCLEPNPCIPLPVEGNCFYVEIAETCDNPIDIIVIDSFDTCEECNMICYKLTDCLLPEHIVVTNTDMSQVLNQVIKFNEYPDACWFVELSDTCEGHVEVTGEFTTYTTCVLCLPQVPVPVIPLNIRKVKPGFDTPGCSPEYTIKVNCRWADIVNSEMMVTRYGVKICCSDDDVVKWNIKKELLDLNSIYDPYACATPPEDCPSC